MRDYRIVTDACCDMNLDILEEHDIVVLPMDVELSSGEHFRHYPDFRNYSSERFYQQIREGITAVTTQIPPAQYEDSFREILAAGQDILYVCFSSGLSGTWHSAMIAANKINEEQPERSVLCLDSLCACGGLGVLALKASENRENGMGLCQNYTWLLQNRLKLAHYFTVGNLETLKRGGRIPPAAAAVGTFLHIRPIMYVDDEGKLALYKKVHGHKAGLLQLVSLTKKTIADPEGQDLFISYTDCHDDAVLLEEMVRKEIPCRDVILTKVGPVVGAHTGTAHICLFSWGSGRFPAQ